MTSGLVRGSLNVYLMDLVILVGGNESTSIGPFPVRVVEIIEFEVGRR
jgi:hypothetical protein